MRIQNSQSGSINFRSTQYPSVSACLYECVNFKQPPLSRLTCVSSAVAVGNDFGAHLIGTSVCGAIRSKCFQDGHFYNEVIGQILLRRPPPLPLHRCVCLSVCVKGSVFLFASGPSLESEAYLVTGGSICSQLHSLLSINTRTYILLGLLTFQESGECLKTLAIYCAGSSPLCFGRSVGVCILSLARPAEGCFSRLKCLLCSPTRGTDRNPDKYVLRLHCSLSRVCVCMCVCVLNCASAYAYVRGCACCQALCVFASAE